jgi:hypothetical protein
MQTTEQSHVANGPDGGALWKITTGDVTRYEVIYQDDRPTISAPPDPLPAWASQMLVRTVIDDAAKVFAQATTKTAEALAEMKAAMKTTTAEKHQDEQLMYSLFGGPPRNRAERRRWARIQKNERARKHAQQQG